MKLILEWTRQHYYQTSIFIDDSRGRPTNKEIEQLVHQAFDETKVATDSRHPENIRIRIEAKP